MPTLLLFHTAHSDHLLNKKDEEKSEGENEVTNGILGRKSGGDFLAHFRDHVQNASAEKDTRRETNEGRDGHGPRFPPGRGIRKLGNA